MQGNGKVMNPNSVNSTLHYQNNNNQVLNSRHNFSPQQQHAMKLQKQMQLQQLQMKNKSMQGSIIQNVP